MYKHIGSYLRYKRPDKTLVLLAAICLIAACDSTTPVLIIHHPAVINATTAATLLQTAVTKAGSVHIVTTLYPSAGISIISDVGNISGRQQVTGFISGEREVIDGATYIRGNQAYLTSELNIADTLANRYANRWISLGNTTGSAPQPLFVPATAWCLPHGPDVHFTGRYQNGSKYRSLTGPTQGGMATVTYTTGDRPLPTECDLHTRGERLTIRYTRWGEPITLTKPINSIPAPASIPDTTVV